MLKSGGLRMRILIVEDEVTSRDLWPRFAALRNHESVVVGDGETALEFLQSGLRFDGVISDYELGPGPTGLDLLRYVAESSHRRGMPFALMTGHLDRDQEIERECKRLGAVLWFKPLSFQEKLEEFEALSAA